MKTPDYISYGFAAQVKPKKKQIHSIAAKQNKTPRSKKNLIRRGDS